MCIFDDTGQPQHVEHLLNNDEQSSVVYLIARSFSQLYSCLKKEK